MANKELLYEKITEISEKKNNLLEENEELKKQIVEYNAKLFENFCDFVETLIDKIDFEKDNIDEGFTKNKEAAIEKKMAKHFINKIKEISITQNLSAKNIAYMIYDKLKGRGM